MFIFINGLKTFCFFFYLSKLNITKFANQLRYFHLLFARYYGVTMYNAYVERQKTTII